LQHLAVTLAGLSIVREVREGTMELFRVSPVSAMETLIGKYVSYLLLTAVLALILTALVTFLLRVPMLGNWYNYALVLFALLFASLGIGFLISITSYSDSQAIQGAMIVLLASIFFSGFFLPLYRLWTFVHVISWSLPATYGTSLLQSVMLRGQVPNTLLVLALLSIGLVLFLLSWWRLSRMMAHE
jgi:ABC-2 type transport system permease protein